MAQQILSQLAPEVLQEYMADLEAVNEFVVEKVIAVRAAHGKPALDSNALRAFVHFCVLNTMLGMKMRGYSAVKSKSR